LEENHPWPIVSLFVAPGQFTALLCDGISQRHWESFVTVSLVLTEYALQRTPNAEEALLWGGWALYRKRDTAGAVADFRKALKANPNGQDAKNALNFVGANP
jgi:hypothetical protein